MMIKNSIKYIFIIIVIIFYNCCNTYSQNQSDFSKFNLAFLYNPGKLIINPECLIYHNEELTSAVFFKQYVNELNFSPKNVKSSEYRYGVRYILRDADNYNIIDSASVNYVVKKERISDSFSSFFKINTPENKSYVLMIIFYCRTTNANKRFLFEIDKSDVFSGENYFVESMGEPVEPKYNNIVYSGKNYKITSGRIKNKSVTVNYYAFDDYMPSPPASTARSSSSFQIPDSVYHYKFGDTIQFENKGIYFFQASENDNSGLILLNAGQFFPKIKTVSQMLEPLQHFCTRREYNEIKKSENLKESIDEFWFSKSNDVRIAKEQIRVFYNRVQLANNFFTDYRKGFKSDRGMIYIIFGAPSAVRRNQDAEEWFYGENPEISGLSFIFYKEEHPVFGHEYKLRRNTTYQTIWGQAISTWRAGRIFLLTSDKI